MYVEKIAHVNYGGICNSGAGEKIATKTASKFPPFSLVLVVVEEEPLEAQEKEKPFE